MSLTIVFEVASAELVAVSPSWAATYACELRSAVIRKGEETEVRKALPLTAAQREAFIAAVTATDPDTNLPTLAVVDGLATIALPVGKRGRKPKSGQSVGAMLASIIAAATPEPKPKRSRKPRASASE